MPKIVFWTGAKPAAIKRTIGKTLQRMTTTPLHKFVPLGEDCYVPAADEVVLAMGKVAVELLAKQGVVPKGRAVEGLRGKLWPSPTPDTGAYMVGYDPGVLEREPGLESDIIWDVQLVARYVLHGSLDAKLGEYRWVDDFAELIDRIKLSFAINLLPVAVAFDIETLRRSPFEKGARIVAMGFTDRVGHADLLYVPRLRDQEHANRVHAQVRWLLTSEMVKLRGANLKFDLNWMLVKWQIACTNFAMDTLLVGSLLDENRSNGLKNHVKIYVTELGGYDFELLKGEIEAMHLLDLDKMRRYLGGDVDGTLRVSIAMLAELAPLPAVRRFYRQILHPGSVAFQRMEREGINVSIPRFKQLQIDLDAEIKTLSAKGIGLLPARLRYKYADNLSMARPALLKDYFFTPMGLNLKPKVFTPKSTKENPTPSTAKSHFEMFFDVPEAKAMCEILDGLGSAEKTLSTYAIGFLKHLRADSKLRPSYFLHNGGNDWGDDDGGTVTGRLSAKDPAIQTTPKKTKWGKRIRECLIAAMGYECVEADFSQGELRLAACIADEPNMIAAYKAGIDLHCKTGAGMIKMPLEEFMALKKTDPGKFALIRGKAKPANFGIIYGISWEGYQSYAWNGYRVKLTDQEAQETVDAFFVTYPELPNWHKRFKTMAHQDGLVTSPLGRVRHLPNIDSYDGYARSKAERQAVNSPVQATLSDMMVWALALVNEQHPEYIPFAMIHDAALWYVPEGRTDEACKNITEIMGNLPMKKVFGWDHQLDFPADASVGPDLGHMEEWKLAA